MKKRFFYVTVSAMALVFAISGCKKPDDDGGGNGPGTDGPTTNPTGIVVKISNIQGGAPNNIHNVIASINEEYDNDKIPLWILDQAEYKNGECTLTLPATVVSDGLRKIVDACEVIDPTVTLSNSDVHWGVVYFDAYDASGKRIGRINDLDYGTMQFNLHVYTTGNTTVNGTKFDCSFKTGWQTAYLYSSGNMTTTPPASKPDKDWTWQPWN